MMTRHITDSEEAITFLLTKISILDSHLESFAVTEDYQSISIRLELTLRRESEFKKVALCLREVEEYSFTNDKTTAGSVIEHVKVFSQNNEIYVSLDPYGAESSADSRDNFIIRARHLRLEVS